MHLLTWADCIKNVKKRRLISSLLLLYSISLSWSGSTLSCRHMGTCTLSLVKRILWFSWNLISTSCRWDLVAYRFLSGYSTRTFNSFHNLCHTNSITIRSQDITKVNLSDSTHPLAVIAFIYNEAPRGGFLCSVQEIASSNGVGVVQWNQTRLSRQLSPFLPSVLCAEPRMGQLFRCKRIFKASLAVSYLLRAEGNIRMRLMYPLRDI